MMDLSYILNHLGEERSQYFSAVAPPMIQSSNFCFSDLKALRLGLENEYQEAFYTRGVNPTVSILRKKIAALEGAQDCLVLASGAAAITASVMSLLKAGDHVLCVSHPYNWAKHLFRDYLPRFDISCSFVDGTQIENFKAALTPKTRLIYLESPNTMTFELQDLRAVVAFARQNGLKTICDNSYSSPLAQKPLEYGVDLVVHSVTKYLNGHSDTVSGAICGNHDLISAIFKSEYMTLGAISSPMEAWLILRGMRTLELRLQRSSESTEYLVEYLQSHPKVAKVYYPFSKTHPQYELAKQQMRCSGGLFSVEFKTSSLANMEAFCNALKLFLLACSWGGYESLCFPIASLYNNEQANTKTHLPWNFVRFYCGIEDVKVLKDDLDQAMSCL